MSPTNERLGLIFTPGGFLGAYSVGFATAIYEAGFRPDYVQGCSVGALNGAALVEDDFYPERLLRIWREVEKMGPACLFDKRDIIRRIFKRKGRYFANLFTDEGLINLVENNINPEAVIRSETEFRVIVRNETRNRMEIFSNHDDAFVNNSDLLKRLVLASASIAGIFPPVWICGDYYSDGETLSISDAINFGCERVFILRNEPVDPNGKDPHDQFWWDRIVSAKHYHYLHYLRTAMKFYDDKVTVFRPDRRILSPSSFEPGDVTDAINHAYHKGQEIIESLD